MKVQLRDFFNQKSAILNDFLQTNLGFNLDYLTSHGSWTLFKEVIVSLLSFINVILITRLFSREMYGQFVFVNATVELIKLVAIPGIFTAVARSVAKGYDGSLFEGFKKQFSYALFGVLILWGVTGYYYWIGNLLLCKAFFIVSLFFPFLDSLKLWWAYLMGKEKFSLIAIKLILLSLITTTIFAIAVITKAGLLFLISTTYALTTFFYLIFFYQIKNTTENTLTSTETITYGWFLTKMRGLSTVVYQIDKVIIGFVSAEILSVFALAQRMTEVIETVLAGPLSITFPKFATLDAKQITNKIIIALFVFGVLICIPIIFLSKSIILFLFTDKYLASVKTFQVLSIAIPFVFVSAIFKRKVEAQKKKKALIQLHFSIPLLSLAFAGIVYYYTASFYSFFFAKILSLKIMEPFYLIYFDKKHTEK